MVKARNAVFFVLMLVFTLAVVESLFFFAGKFLQSKHGMWAPPGDPNGERRSMSYEEHLKQRDPVLGWPSRPQYGKDLDVNGAQRNPYFANGPQEGSCVSLYGDSFTQGWLDASSPGKNWGNLLSNRMACYVANFGVAGYGTDQAYLRFAENRSDRAPVVIFGLHTEDVLRNLTRVRDLQNYAKWYALKPRFILNDRRELKLVPIPTLTEEEYLRVVGLAGDPLILEHEDFQPGGAAGVVKLEFPYTVSVAKNMMRFYGFRSRLFHRPEWMEFLQRGHALHGLEITVGITRKFVELAEQRGEVPLVVILPHLLDLKYFLDKGSWPYQVLVEDYAQSSIPFIDFGPYLVADAQERGKDVEEYYGPTHHYNDEGNALVARFVYDRLAEKALVPAKR
jgi:hypothetical protein